MAHRITVQCPDCEPARVSPSDVVVRWCIDDGAWSYRSRCRWCSRLFVAPTNARRARVAVEAGVELEAWSLPRELGERPGGAPLSIVDLLELRLELIEPDVIDRLRAESSAT